MTTNTTAGPRAVIARASLPRTYLLELIVNQTDPTAAEVAQHVTRAIFALKTPSPDGSKHYQSGWDDGLEAAMDAAREAVMAVLPEQAHRAAEEVDADTVANRAAQVITTMGADIRALTHQRDRYRTAWRSARQRAQAYGEGILRHVADRDFWKRQYNAEHDRHVAVVGALVTDRTAVRAEAFTEAADEPLKAIDTEWAGPDRANARRLWLYPLVDRVRRLAVEAHDTGTQQPDRPFRDEPTEVLQAALDLATTHAQQAARFRPAQSDGALPAVADLFQAELQHREGQTTADRAEELIHVGWWCWRGDNHGHLATMACRSDNVPIHVPAEWADEMRAVIQRIEDGDDEPAPVAQQPAADACTAPPCRHPFTIECEKGCRAAVDELTRLGQEMEQQAAAADTAGRIAEALDRHQHGDYAAAGDGWVETAGPVTPVGPWKPGAGEQQPAAEAGQPLRHAPGTVTLCSDCRAKGYAICLPAEQQPAAADGEETRRCVCGDPIQLMDESDPTNWIHSPGSDTRCLDARPRP